MKHLLKTIFLVTTGITVFLFSCNNKNSDSPKNAEKTTKEIKPEVQVIKKTRKLAERDRSITMENSYSNMFLNTAAVTNFLAKSILTEDEKIDVQNFYAQRNYEYAWFDSTGVDEQALNFMSADRSYISLTSGKDLQNDSSLLANFNRVIADSAKYDATKSIITKTELQLTAQFFRYARQAFKTDNDEVVDLNWFVPKKKININAYLSDVTAGKKTAPFEPAAPEYQKLKEALKQYAKVQKDGGWDTTLRPGAKAYRMGQSSAAIRAIKKRLHLTGDLPRADSTPQFDEGLVAAVNHFARRMGFKEDSAVGANLLTEMNQPIEWRIQQIIINMERLKWAPARLPDNYISANIPEYKLHVYEGGKRAWDMDIVVGNAQHSTVVFSSNLKYIAFSPYWNVPYSITKHEIGRSAGYLKRHNMEIVGRWGDGLPRVRQKPGGANSLGGVKFLFPNEYDIYFHDTPAKSLFSRDKRAGSHGCIRLAEPAKMAAYLLRYDTAWSADSIQTAMHLKKEKRITLPNNHTLAVFISYYTAWVNDEGLYCFRPDIYRHDRAMAKRLFVE